MTKTKYLFRVGTQVLISIQFWAIRHDLQKKQKNLKIPNLFLAFSDQNTCPSENIFEIQTRWYFREIKLRCKILIYVWINLITRMHVKICDFSKLQKSQTSAGPRIFKVPLQLYYSSGSNHLALRVTKDHWHSIAKRIILIMLLSLPVELVCLRLSNWKSFVSVFEVVCLRLLHWN